MNHPLNDLTFKWTKAQERIETIQKYQFQISTDSLFGTLFVNDSTLIDTSRIVNGMGYLTKYFWRVRALNQTGWGDWSATWKFTTIVEKPTVPVMVIPANNTLGLIDPVTFKWNKSQRVEKYAIQLSRTEAFDQVFFSGETFDTLKIYSSTIAPLLPNTRYYWRVRATNIGGYSDWTTGWTFKMLGNPYASTQLQPANQSVNQPVTGLTFKWTKAQERIETIQKYQFQISTDSLFVLSLSMTLL
ncbi:MAG: fibronectin type III domain-containing protein [Ignavibacteriales bacterium]|nr:fibronectin type III domain-containing protein [Ignavibacteriales bacterium]